MKIKKNLGNMTMLNESGENMPPTFERHITS